MTRRATTRYRYASYLLWAIAVAHAVLAPGALGVHLVIIGGAITATLLAVLGGCLLDLRRAQLLALQASVAQGARQHARADL